MVICCPIPSNFLSEVVISQKITEPYWRTAVIRTIGGVFRWLHRSATAARASAYFKVTPSLRKRSSPSTSWQSPLRTRFAAQRED